jgi:hypothetical protein
MTLLNYRNRQVSRSLSSRSKEFHLLLEILLEASDQLCGHFIGLISPCYSTSNPDHPKNLLL